LASTCSKWRSSFNVHQRINALNGYEHQTPLLVNL
jgi:hypothetical protein